jgi:hypothetical protein
MMVVSVWIATAHLEIGPGVAWGQSTVADQPVASVQPVVQDNFDDNKRGTLWKAFAEDPNVQVKEVSKHLEFTAVAKGTGVFAGYVGDKWSIDPNHDFAMKIDLSYDLVTYNGGWLTFGVTPSPDKPRDKYVSFGLGCVSLFRSYWREYKDGYEVRWTFEGRGKDKTTLYISYDSANDILYMGEAGYGSENAWEVLPDLVRGRWPNKPLYVFVGFYAEAVDVAAGHAFADNFALDSGVLVNASTPNNPPGGDPNQPGGGGQQADVTAETSITPSVIKRQGTARPISAFLTLPKGFVPADIDDMQPMVLVPGGAETMKRTAFVWLTGQMIVVTSFDRAKLLQAVSANGDVSLQVTGRLKDGRYFGGTDTVKIE